MCFVLWAQIYWNLLSGNRERKGNLWISSALFFSWNRGFLVTIRQCAHRPRSGVGRQRATMSASGTCWRPRLGHCCRHSICRLCYWSFTHSSIVVYPHTYRLLFTIHFFNSIPIVPFKRTSEYRSDVRRAAFVFFPLTYTTILTTTRYL